MSIVTPAAGVFSLAQELLRVSIADSATFRTLVDADTQAKALERIHLDELPPAKSKKGYEKKELQQYRPYVILWAGGYRGQHSATGSAYEYERSGAFKVQFVLDIDQEVSHNGGEVGRRFMNTVIQIVEDMLALSGQAGYLAIEDFDIAEAWTRTAEEQLETEGDAATIEVEFRWGVTR